MTDVIMKYKITVKLFSLSTKVPVVEFMHIILMSEH